MYASKNKSIYQNFSYSEVVVLIQRTVFSNSSYLKKFKNCDGSNLPTQNHTDMIRDWRGTLIEWQLFSLNPAAACDETQPFDQRTPWDLTWIDRAVITYYGTAAVWDTGYTYRYLLYTCVRGVSVLWDHHIDTGTVYSSRTQQKSTLQGHPPGGAQPFL